MSTRLRGMRLMGRLRLTGDRSPNWALMERFDVPNVERPTETRWTRWRVVQTPLFGIYVHRLNEHDNRPTFHDHPWSFVSIILSGGYTETFLAEPQRVRTRYLLDDVLRRAAVTRTWRRFSVHAVRAHNAHIITGLDRSPTWTIMLVGPRWRQWGYWDDEGWTQFDQHRHAHEFHQALLEREEARR